MQGVSAGMGFDRLCLFLFFDLGFSEEGGSLVVVL